MRYKIAPSDVIGALGIIGCFVLIAMGKDSYIQGVLLIIIGYFFGQKSKQ